MPSRKRGKGKARKAKAKAAATNANAAAVPATISRQVPTAIPDLNQLMGGLSLAETECNHGLPPLPPATTARAFLLAFDAIAGKIVKTGRSDYTVRFSKVMDGVFRLGLESALYDLADREALLAGHVSTPIVKYFAQRISCSCLNERYAASKEQPKLGQCSCCRVSKDRSQLLLCSNCNFAQYCSKDCQERHWLRHKALCRYAKSSSRIRPDMSTVE